jgi:hypothetical protein
LIHYLDSVIAFGFSNKLDTGGGSIDRGNSSSQFSFSSSMLLLLEIPVVNSERWHPLAPATSLQEGKASEKHL